MQRQVKIRAHLIVSAYILLITCIVPPSIKAFLFCFVVVFFFAFFWSCFRINSVRVLIHRLAKVERKRKRLTQRRLHCTTDNLSFNINLRGIGHFQKYHNSLCLSVKILHKHCFHFPLGPTMVPRENKNNANKSIMVFLKVAYCDVSLDPPPNTHCCGTIVLWSPTTFVLNTDNSLYLRFAASIA